MPGQVSQSVQGRGLPSGHTSLTWKTGLVMAPLRAVSACAIPTYPGDGKGPTHVGVTVAPVLLPTGYAGVKGQQIQTG